MSGPPKGKKRDAAPTPPGEPFVPVKPAPVITADENVKPPPVREIVRCKDCRWGQDQTIGQRRCRGATPTPLYRSVHGYAGDLVAAPMWPVVRDEDWCRFGEKA